MTIYDKEECEMYYGRKYKYMKIEDIDLLYETALEILMNLKYPFVNEITDDLVEKTIAKHRTWCLRAMQEMINKQGLTNVIGYSENGISMTFDKTGLSQSLIDEIVSQAGIS